ncbi:MAG: hypothetical protein OQK82_02095 [Candidatus Pacearchaeota archaeon]|nr:hypothetical protein [Candidatus Pacearchaeota archaeon]
MKEDFTRRKVTIAGIQESGKTEFCKYVLRTQFKRPIVYSLNKHDWEKENVFLFVPEDYKADLVGFLNFVHKHNKKGVKKFDAIFFDDFDLFFDGVNSNSLPPILNNLNAMHRHPPWYLASLFATRRPQDIGTKVAETSHCNIVFPIEGDNAKKKYNNIDPEIVRCLEKLKYQDWRYVVKWIGKKPYINNPVPFKK